MRAAVVQTARGKLAVSDQQVPVPAVNELLVAVQASSVNPIDVYVATGQYTLGELRYPLIPGHDFAGTIEAVGTEVGEFAPGDRVLGMWSKDAYQDGAWAEYVTVPTDGLVTRWPDGLESVRAAALPLAGLTAALTVQFLAPVPEEPLVVIGAAGAVGRYVVQLASRAGADVTATARAGSEPAAISLGARATIDPADGSLADVAAARFPGGMPMLVDLVSGRRTLARLSEHVCDGGRVVSARMAADVKALAVRGIRASNVRTYDASAAMLGDLASAAAAGELEVALDDVVSLDELSGVVDCLATGERKGKLAVNLV